ncbi:ADL1 [Symbiodinium natans]|uniref:ADL1 protein n=1 Tax=Symbiodinium natans TaxID=878477 RepID=A0A812TJF7_9DINO|nr:ADL1 [Symbiodinium natans]
MSAMIRWLTLAAALTLAHAGAAGTPYLRASAQERWLAADNATNSSTTTTTTTTTSTTSTTSMAMSTTTNVDTNDTNSTNGTNTTGTTSSREITTNEIMALSFAGAGLLLCVGVHLLLAPASYRLDLLMAAHLSRKTSDATFSRVAPFVQWLMIACLFLPVACVALAAQQVSTDSWRLSSLGSLVAVTIYFGSLGLGRAATDSFHFSWLAFLFSLMALLCLGCYFCQFVWWLDPFSFTSVSVVMLCVSAVPSIALAFLCGSWQGSGSMLAFLSGDQAQPGPATALPRSKPKRIGLIASLVVLELGVLGAYGLAVRVLATNPEARDVGFVLVAAVVNLDAIVWLVWALGLVTGGAQTALLMVAARVAACAWGEDYWLMGHSGVFLAMVTLLAHMVVNAMIPAPDSPQVRRQRAAADMLETLQARIAGGSGSGDHGDHATPVSLAAPATIAKWKKWLPAVVMLGIMCLFAGEVALVTFLFELPSISWCNTCDARPQQYYAGVALGAGFVYAVSLYGHRRSQLQAFGKKGPLLETAPLGIVVPYFCWVGVGAYTSWVADSWAVLVHVSFLPLILGLFFSAHHRWVVDDFHLTPRPPSATAKIAPEPSSTGTGGDPASDGGADPADPVGAGGSSVAAEDRPTGLARVPWTVRIWLMALLLDIAYGVVLHLVSEVRFRWVGWSISAGVLVLALTFMSNRMWFGTFQLYPEQPIFWGFIALILLAWAGGVWYFHREMKVDDFAAVLLCVVVLYPAVYVAFLALQVLRDAKWSPKDASTFRFVRNGIIFSTVVYLAFLGALALLNWAAALGGFCLLLMAAVLGLAFWKWLRNNRYISDKVKLASAVAVALCVLGSAVGITFYFQSIFGGFTAVCVGVTLLLVGDAASEVSAAQSRTALEQLRVESSNFVFPMFRFRGGELARAHTDIAAAMEALGVISLWGLVAAVVLDDYPAVGMVVGVLALMGILILWAHLVARGGLRRAMVLEQLPQAQLLAAAKEALDGGLGGAKVADAGSESDKDTQQKLVQAVQEFATGCKCSMDEFQSQVKVACAGRFHTFPLIAFWQMLNAGVALIRKGQGCVANNSPEHPREEHQKLLTSARKWLSAVCNQQRFDARLQLCLLSAQMQQMWAKESEFRAFLQSTGAEAKGLTMDDFKQLPEADRKELETAWQAWKAAEVEKQRLEDERRKEEEEAARRRLEEQRRRKADARQAVETLLKDQCGEISKIQAALNAALGAGVQEADAVVAEATQRVQELRSAEELLQKALAIDAASEAAVQELQNAVEHAQAACLQSDLIQQARDKITQIQGTLSAEEEAERKRKEAERLKKLQEEAKERRKKAEEERRKKEEEDRLKRAGEPKVVEANLTLLKSVAERTGEFTDNVFTPEAMGEKATSSSYRIQRLRQIVGDGGVELFFDGFNPNDIHQGELGDCWFLSAIACLSAHGKLVEKLFTYSDAPKGLYVVRFYKNGVFQDVTIDDFFPTKYGQCAFASSGKKAEAWVQVLEKAYAKLHGSYDSIEGGFVNDALVDMTGGIGEKMHLHDKAARKEINDGTMWAKLLSLSRDGHLLGCGSGAGKDTETSDMGIVKGHAYSLLRVEEVEGHRLLQLRNPWGSTEWKGKWSDGDKDSWTQKMKKKLDYVNADDGSFWMAFEDFVNHYRSVYICRLFEDGWNRCFACSEWRGETAGGCRNYPTYEKNPKIQLTIKGRVNLILTLEQADSRGAGEGEGEVPIGFRVYRDRSLSGNGICGTSTYAYDRELCVDVELKENTAGPYIILPTTFKPNMERGFIMKAFWKGAPDAVQMQND